MENMSENDQVSGPVMLCVTKVMDPGGLRIARLWGNVTLPRTVPVKSLIAGGSGALFGLFIGALLGGGVPGLTYGGVFGAGSGIALVSWSPLKNETFWRWLTLHYETRRRQITVDGRPVIVAVGICRISTPARGSVRIAPGAINVPPSQRDERGAVISAHNRNLPTTAAGEGDDPGGHDSILVAALEDGAERRSSLWSLGRLLKGGSAPSDDLTVERSATPAPTSPRQAHHPRPNRAAGSRAPVQSRGYEAPPPGPGGGGAQDSSAVGVGSAPPALLPPDGEHVRRPWSGRD